MSEPKIEVTVNCFSDRGDPYPPNNWRCDIYIDGVRYTTSPGGCTSERKAKAAGRRVGKILNRVPKING